MYAIKSEARGWYRQANRETGKIEWNADAPGLTWRCADGAQRVLLALQEREDCPEDAKVVSLR